MCEYLYNITFDEEDTRILMKPSIPITVAPGEDTITPRICLSDSIEHCIEAIGSCHRNLKVGALIIVRKIEKSKLVKKYLIEPEVLFSSGRVPDALETREHWYCANLRMQYEIFSITNFISEYDLAWSCIDVEDVKEIVKGYNEPDLYRRIHKMNDPKEVYKYSYDYFEAVRDYELMDNLYDDIAELPWSQRIRITRLELNRVA